MKRNWVIIGIVIIVVIIVGVILAMNRLVPGTQPAAASARATTASVTRGNLVATVSAAGNIAAPEDAQLAFQQSGRVSKVNVQVGDVVKKGQLLMEVDTSDLELALKTAQTNLVNAQANLESAKIKNAQNPNQLLVAKASLDKAQIALQKAQADYNTVAWRPDVGMTPQAQALQSATIDYQSALANYQMTASNINDLALKQAQTQVDSAQLAVDQAKRNIEKARIYAPFDGVVSAVNVSVGDNASGVAVVVVDLNQLQVKVTVAEVDIAKIKIGQTANMTLDALPGKTYTAKVLAIAPVATVTQGVVNYPVTVAVTNADGQIKPGMTANLQITVDQRENVLLVPLRAVRTQGNQRTVTVQYQGQDIPVPVTIGLTNDQFAEITSPGLKEGDQLVLNQTTTRTGTGGGPGGGAFFIGGPGGGR
jgi:HlyD family secretion protein